MTTPHTSFNDYMAQLHIKSIPQTLRLLWLRTILKNDKKSNSVGLYSPNLGPPIKKFNKRLNGIEYYGSWNQILHNQWTVPL